MINKITDPVYYNYETIVCKFVKDKLVYKIEEDIWDSIQTNQFILIVSHSGYIETFFEDFK